MSARHSFQKWLCVLAVSVFPLGASAQLKDSGLALIAGGGFQNPKSNFFGKGVTVKSFYIGKYEVSQKEWTNVMGDHPATFKGDDLPVETVSWYDCIEFCNRRSLKEGLRPYYRIDKNRTDQNNHTAIDTVKWTVTIDSGANGYRLPTEAEWEYAAIGGQRSQQFVYCGANDLDQVGWFWQNSGDTFLSGTWSWRRIQENHGRTQPEGQKIPNELGLYDMSGNIREWCWDWFGPLSNNGVSATESTAETGRVWKGGGWLGGDFCCVPSFRASYEASGKGPDQGLRICRNP